MKRLGWCAVAAGILVALLAVVAGMAGLLDRDVPSEWIRENRPPRIRPDYAGTVIPPNIAPLNFAVEEPGKTFFVRIHGPNGRPIDVPARGKAVIIPAGPWKQLLSDNRGGAVSVDVYVKEGGGWKRFETITNSVAEEEIDTHLVYRLLGPAFFTYHRIAICQRDLESFDETPILRNASFGEGCVNCHAFAANRPERFSLHVRPPAKGGFRGGMVGVENGNAFRIEMPSTAAPTLAAYISWHPTEPLAAFSMNNQGQFIRGAGVESREVYDVKSDLAVVDARTQAVSPSAGAAGSRRLNTFPAWSADGNCLYYCSAPAGPDDTAKPPYADYDKVKYDLMRIAYDARTGAWGKPETVLTAAKTGLSISEPRASPDGRFLVFCTCPYGAFPVLSAGADLCLMDLAESGGRAWRPLKNANSGDADSWHCWSGNSRWIVFSSKRGTGLFARPYFCYIDREGNDHKPFLLPQKDPFFYDTCLQTYNVPELVCGPITVGEDELARAILSEAADP